MCMCQGVFPPLECLFTMISSVSGSINILWMNECILKTLPYMFPFFILLWFRNVPNFSPLHRFYLLHSILSLSARLIFLTHRFHYVINFSLPLDKLVVFSHVSLWHWPCVCNSLEKAGQVVSISASSLHNFWKWPHILTQVTLISFICFHNSLELQYVKEYWSISSVRYLVTH